MREARGRRTDRLVYELYGLTEEEIEVVEENAAQGVAIARRQVLSFSRGQAHEPLAFLK